MGNRTTMTSPFGGQSYNYDALYRITNPNYPGQSDAYIYDANGNRTLYNEIQYSYDAADQLTCARFWWEQQCPSGGTAYAYDANGNQTSRGTDSFTYDHENRLTSTSIGGVSGTYTYNGDGLRASRNIGGTSVSYTWDVGAGLPVILQDSQGNTYVYGLDLISRTDSGGNQEYYLYDGLGSTTDLTNGSGTTIASYSYDVFGAIRSQTGSSANEFKFTGEQVDSTSLQYLRARYYDPAIGRFLSQDPVAGSAGDPGTLNRYAYVLNNPIGRVDPLGYQGAEVAAGTVTVSCTAGAAASVGSACVVGLAVAGGVVVYYTCYVGEACDALGGAMIDGAGKIANASADAVTGVGEGALDLGGDVIGGIKGLFSKGDSKYHPKYNEDPGLRNIGHEFRRPTSWNFPWPPRGCAQFQGIRKAVCWAFVAGGLSYAGDRLIGPFLGGTAPPLAGEKSP